MTMQDYLADAQQLIPPGEVVEAVHRWQDKTGNRVRFRAGRVQYPVTRRRLRIVEIEEEA